MYLKIKIVISKWATETKISNNLLWVVKYKKNKLLFGKFVNIICINSVRYRCNTFQTKYMYFSLLYMIFHNFIKFIHTQWIVRCWQHVIHNVKFCIQNAICADMHVTGRKVKNVEFRIKLQKSTIQSQDKEKYGQNSKKNG